MKRLSSIGVKVELKTEGIEQLYTMLGSATSSKDGGIGFTLTTKHMGWIATKSCLPEPGFI